MNCFGEKIEGCVYLNRRGAYAVILDVDKQVAGIAGTNGHFLPGGGIEEGETDKEALQRELIEECSASIEIIAPIGNATDYLYASAEDAYFEKQGTFYLSRFTTGYRSDKLGWIPQEQIKTSFRQAGHSWAVLKALESMAGEMIISTLNLDSR